MPPDAPGFFDLLTTIRDLPKMGRAAMQEAAVAVGLDVLPELWAIVKKNDAGKWELVSISLDRELLPAPAADEFRISARPDFSP